MLSVIIIGAIMLSKMSNLEEMWDDIVTHKIVYFSFEKKSETYYQ